MTLDPGSSFPQQQSQGQSYSNTSLGAIPAYLDTAFQHHTSHQWQDFEDSGTNYRNYPNVFTSGKMPATTRSHQPESSVDHAGPSKEHHQQQSQQILQEDESNVEPESKAIDDGQESSAAWVAGGQRKWVKVNIVRGHKGRFQWEEEGYVSK